MLTGAVCQLFGPEAGAYQILQKFAEIGGEELITQKPALKPEKPDQEAEQRVKTSYELRAQQKAEGKPITGPMPTEQASMTRQSLARRDR